MTPRLLQSLIHIDALLLLTLRRIQFKSQLKRNPLLILHIIMILLNQPQSLIAMRTNLIREMAPRINSQ